MPAKKLTFHTSDSGVDVHGSSGFRSNNNTSFTLHTNETLNAGHSNDVNAVLLDLQGLSISIGLFPAGNTAECQNNRVGSAGLPGSVACKIGGGQACVLSNGQEWDSVVCDTDAPVLLRITIIKGVVTFLVAGSTMELKWPLYGDVRIGVSTETGQQCGALVEKTGQPGIADATACFLAAGDDKVVPPEVERSPRRLESTLADTKGHGINGPEVPPKTLTFNDKCSAMDVRGRCGFQSKNKAPCTLYTNETLDSSRPIEVNFVLLDLKDSNVSIGLFPAHHTAECQSNRIGSSELPGSVACKIGGGRARVLSDGKDWGKVTCDSTTPVLVRITVENGIASFFVNGIQLACPPLAESLLHGALRVGVSTETGQQRGALVEKKGLSGIADAKACFSEAGGGGGGGDDSSSSVNAPEIGPLYTDASQLKLVVEEDCPVVALTSTVFRCNEAKDGTMYALVPLGTEETAAIGASVRFTGVKNGFVGCGFFKKAALDDGEAHQHLVGKTAHSIGCLLKNGEVLVYIDDKPVFSGRTADADELTMHLTFDRTKGMHVHIDNVISECDELKDLSRFSGDLYFAVSLSEEGQLARILPSGLGAPRFHYGINSMDVDEDKLMSCKHSVSASLSAHERWYGNAEKVFTMRITNVCRERIGIGVVSAKLWNDGKRNMVGNKDFGPHSIGLLIKDRRVYVHYQDELVEWKPVGRMPPIAKNVDLVMRVSGGKVSFFYQGIPVILPVVSELTLPSDERFRVAYTMSDKGQTAVIPPNVTVRAPDSVARRCRWLGDAVHVELTDHHHHCAQALFAGALCFSSEVFAITPSPWAAYPQGCSSCKCRMDSTVRTSRTLWLCAQCGAPDEFALCDRCYWDAALARKHGHDRNQFIPLFGTGLYEMHLTVDSAKDSYMEVGVAPAGYEDGFGAFAANASVVLGQVPELVKCSMPASKLAAGCPVLKCGDEVCLRVDGAALSVLVNGASVFETTLSADEPFMTLPLRFAVRMGCIGQKVRLHRADLIPESDTVPRTRGALSSTLDSEPLIVFDSVEHIANTHLSHG